ncbi:hypothetical protein SAMN05518854_11751 [Variovorax sp. YR266]|uniref:hypothetical protein n=1 Tax=Variovorax sp. YR266 TaxID=1884386 RepID=UPI00089B5B5E|nr:hypothetical protein [Variovorax sp. YR266]SDZ71261.1 hypothetical protein SAMN05518854_11751 [Variovorax sp. YR266]
MKHQKTRHRRPVRTRAELARSGPVATAVALQRMSSHMTTVSIDIYLTSDGEPARELLSHLGWLIALGAEISATVKPGMPEAKRLHAALRTVIQMSMDNAWQSSQAGTLDIAANESKALLIAHASIGLDLIASADWLASRIRDGQARLSDVAGAEIYSNEPTGASV